MTEAAIDFAALGRAQRVEPVVLIAGLPVVFTPGGVRPTSVSVSSGTVHPLWWPGTGSLTETLPGGASWDPVRDLLDPRTVWSFASALELVAGTIRVEPVAIDFLDTGRAATAIFSRRAAAVAQLLAAELSFSGSTATLASTTGFASAGIAHVGREAIGYTGKTSTTLTGLTRGLFGSAPLPHRVGSNRGATDPVVVGNTLPRYVQGRRATVWLCRVEGSALYDPTLVFTGLVGAGITLVGNGARWQITLDPMTEVLSRAPELPVELYGWHHGNTVNSGLTPLTYLGPAINSGWSPNLAAVIEAWNYTGGLRASTGLKLSAPEGKLRVTNEGGTYNPAIVTSYLEPNQLSVASGASADFNDGPDTCLVLEGTIKLASNDFARVPSTLTYTVTDPAPGTAHVALIADTDETKHFAALVASRDAGTSTVQLSARSTARATERIREARITQRTTARVGILARGDNAVGALKALATALSETGGSDDFTSAVDWDRIAAVFRSVPAVGLPEGREYEVGGGDDSLVKLLADEARLRGCTLTVRRGRLSVVRAASFASSEAVGVVAITDNDQLCEGGVPVPIEVIDQPEPPATTISFMLKGDVELRYTDDTFAAEFGTSTVAECGALRWVAQTTPPARELPLHALASAAQQILGVLAEPQRIVRIPLPTPFVGLEPGDIVTLTHAMVPAWDGTRGVTEAVCQVDEVQREIFGGKARLVASLRLGETQIGGYAPEALVAAGGLSGGSAVVSLDATSAFGTSCFAPPGESPAYGFQVGDVVVLSQYDAATITVTEITRTLVAVDPVAHTLTLDSAPSAGMVAQAASAYGVVVRTAAWTAVTADQQARNAFVADDATNAFSDGDDPKRWAA